MFHQLTSRQVRKRLSPRLPRYKMKTKQHTPSLEGFGAPCFFFCHDPDGTITYVSPSVQQVLGHSPELAIGSSFQMILVPDHPLNADVARCEDACLDLREQYNFLRVVFDSEGNEKVLAIQTNGAPNENGEIEFIQGIAMDVTETYFECERLIAKLAHLRSIRSKLKPRELQVLELLVAGRLNKQIAVDLSVSMRTVESIRSRIMSKLNAHHVAQIATMESEIRLLQTVLSPMRSLFEKYANYVETQIEATGAGC